MTLVKDILKTMDYGPAPEGAEHVLVWLKAHEDGFGHFINGRFTKPAALFDVFNPAKAERIARVSQGSAADVDAAVAAARKAQGQVGGAFRPRTREASLCAGAACAEARALPLGAGVARQRQADPRIARHRRAARRPALLPSRRLGDAGRERISGNEAGRRLRADHPVELSAADARLEDRAGSGRRQ